ncbi:MAG TPA: type I restriction endonuclease subunit R [bacterium]|nr:type I restriction endonuclease subunit R [bacterium]HPG46903.1 type I restriction endonuclease subunit R [bacterium]
MTTEEVQARLQRTFPDTEEAVELTCMLRFAEMGWELIQAEQEMDGDPRLLGRSHQGEVVLTRYLLPMLQKLNPELPEDALIQAIDELCRARVNMSIVRANHDIYHLLKQGVSVTYRDDEGIQQTAKVSMLDWQHPEQNHFLLVSQFWVAGDPYRKRADLVGFVNGIPLLFIELKAPHVNVKDAYHNNLRDYLSTVPQLFWYNGFTLLSNGSQAKMGTATSDWEHFAEWKRINDEGETGVISLETLLRGTCTKTLFMDLLENFVLFRESREGWNKIISKNHQYLGVNNALQAFKQIQQNKGKLGVFWHTQGSGKSYSIIFFCQKVLRKYQGHYTFVIVTDRTELDDQIHTTFLDCEITTEKYAKATSSRHLRQLLSEDHRFVFTLIHKFRTDDGSKHPVLSDRDDIIVITDEAHRSQYDTLAQNMRDALPHAAFLGFTGTPLIKGEEERTREVFGDYVSIYNFGQAIEDGATVPLYYENRIPELQLKNEYLNEDLNQLLDAAMLNEEQERRIEREFSQMYQIITRDDRLERIAEDVVQHFMERAYLGKAMFVAIDKATAVRMYDKVRKHWLAAITDLEQQLQTAKDEQHKLLLKKLRFMQETDMAVVVSSSQNEVEDMKQKGVDILPHRRRIVKEDLATKFKDAKDPFRMVFVCAMWMTGFDVPSCSTIYLDKPMRNHTLMQTIARANRVFGDKPNGLVVDYVGVFRNLEKALAIWAAPDGGKVDMPVKDKDLLREPLLKAIEETVNLFKSVGVDLDEIRLEKEIFTRIKLKDDAVNAILESEDTKKDFMQQASIVEKIHNSYLPSPLDAKSGERVYLIKKIAKQIRSLAGTVDVTEVMTRVEELLDQSVKSFKIVEPQGGFRQYDLSKIDFNVLRQRFEQGRKRIILEQLKQSIEEKLAVMIQVNYARIDYEERYREMLKEFTDGQQNLDEIFARLIEFSQSLNQEDTRYLREGLEDEQQLAVFDILMRPELKLTKDEVRQIKVIARDLLQILQQEKMVLDWKKKQQARAGVKNTIARILDRLPRVFTKEIYEEKCDLVYKYVYNIRTTTPLYA